MTKSIVKLSVPAEPRFARSIRMLAANLAVVAGLSIDDVEDVRMAAEEGFVYASATTDDALEVTFGVSEGEVDMAFSLGDREPQAEQYAPGSFSYVELILAAVSDEYEVDDEAGTLRVTKRTLTDDELGVDSELV